LAINSNLGFERDKLDEFIASIDGLPAVDIYTSCEAIGTQAEYIRDGLDYAQFQDNFEYLLQSDRITAVHSMCTINALCLSSLTDYLNWLVTLKLKYGKERVNFTLNILRFPSFQSALTLPDEIRTEYKLRLVDWLDTHRHQDEIIHEHEINHVERLIDYLDVVKTPHSDTFDKTKLDNDVYHFYQQYDQRRGKDFGKTFPELNEWFTGLNAQAN